MSEIKRGIFGGIDTVSRDTINKGQTEYQDKCLARMSKMPNWQLESLCYDPEMDEEIIKLRIRIRELEDKRKMAGVVLMQRQKENVKES
jgi:hypothetical protein